MNGHNGNGSNGKANHSNGQKRGSGNLVLSSVKNKKTIDTSKKSFDQPVVLKQSPFWSRSIIWTLIGCTVFGITWATFAKMEQVVRAPGQLKPKGAVKEIQVPLNGVVRQVYVEDGDQVKEGELLFLLDSTTSNAELKSLGKIRQSLLQENQFYRAVMAAAFDPVDLENAIIRLNLPKEIASLVRNRAAIIQENQILRAQLGVNDGNGQFSAEELNRLQASRIELASRAAAARLEVEQLQKQLAQNQVQLANAKIQLASDRLVLAEIRQRNQKAIAQAEQSMSIEQSILDDVSPLVEEGALAAISARRQQQEVNDRQATLVRVQYDGKIEYDRQEQEVQTRLSELEQLLEEQQRLTLDIQQAREQFANTKALSVKDILDQIASNQQRIADIDSQLSRTMVSNEQRLAEISSRISAAQQTLKYQEVRSPVSGTVFDLKASPGYVPPNSSNQVNPVVKIVPDDRLVAEVFVPSKDIGFVREDMIADIRIDSFPFNEFGDIKGKVISVGSDALPPDQEHNFYRFPVKIRLDQQTLHVNDREMPLQSGMSVGVNIKIRENRTVLSIFTEQFTREVESLKEMR